MLQTPYHQPLPQLIPLHQVPDLIPSSRQGKRLALATLYRWVTKRKLGSVKIGGSRYVTREAMVALTRGEQPAAPPAVTATARAQQAGEELERLIRSGRRKRSPQSRPANAHPGSPRPPHPPPGHAPAALACERHRTGISPDGLCKAIEEHDGICNSD